MERVFFIKLIKLLEILNLFIIFLVCLVSSQATKETLARILIALGDISFKFQSYPLYIRFRFPVLLFYEIMKIMPLID